MIKQEKLFCSALGTLRKEGECKHPLDIDPLSLEKLLMPVLLTQNTNSMHSVLKRMFSSFSTLVKYC